MAGSLAASSSRTAQLQARGNLGPPLGVRSATGEGGERLGVAEFRAGPKVSAIWPQEAAQFRRGGEVGDYNLCRLPTFAQGEKSEPVRCVARANDSAFPRFFPVTGGSLSSRLRCAVVCLLLSTWPRSSAARARGSLAAGAA